MWGGPSRRGWLGIVGVIAAGLAPGVFGSVAGAGFDVTADVSITKTDGVASVVAGGNVTYTVVVSNAGPDAVAPTVTDPMPAQLASMSWTCAAAGGADCAFGSGSGSLEDFPNLPIGGSVTYAVTGTVRSDATGMLVNTASVVGAFDDPNVADNTATDTDTVTQQADLSVTIGDGVASVGEGQTVVYNAVVANAGPSDVSSADLLITVPALIVDPWSWTCVGDGGATCPVASSSGAVNISNFSMPAGGSMRYTITGVVGGSPGDSIVVTPTVSVDAPTVDPNLGNNTATDTNLIVPVSDLSIIVTGPATALAGDQLTYALTVANAGPSASSPVTMTDVLPAGTTFVSAAQTSGPPATLATPAVGAGGTFTATWGSLDAGATATFELVVDTDESLVPGDEISNTAIVAEEAGQVASFGFTRTIRPALDPNAGNNSSTSVTEIVAPPVVTTTTAPPGPTTTTITTIEPPGSTTTTQPSSTTSTSVAASGGALPRTGSGTTAIGWVAALALAAGATAVVLSRRPRREV